MIPESTVVVVGRAPEKMREAAAVLEADGFTVIGVFSEVEALRAIADHGSLLAVVAGGSVSPDARERLRFAAAPRGALVIDAFIGHEDPADHFRSVVLPQLVAARAARTDDHPQEETVSPTISTTSSSAIPNVPSTGT